MGPRCVVCREVYSKTKNPYTSFHRFPKSEELRRKWFTALGIPPFDTRYHSICAKHFPDDSFYITPIGRRFLKKTAVPILGGYSLTSETVLSDVPECGLQKSDLQCHGDVKETGPFTSTDGDNILDSKSSLPNGQKELTFPQHSITKAAWFECLGLQYDKDPDISICSKHFLPSAFIDVNGRQLLKKRSLPVSSRNKGDNRSDEDEADKRRLSTSSISSSSSIHSSEPGSDLSETTAQDLEKYLDGQDLPASSCNSSTETASENGVEAIGGINTSGSQGNRNVPPTTQFQPLNLQVHSQEPNFTEPERTVKIIALNSANGQIIPSNEPIVNLATSQLRPANLSVQPPKPPNTKEPVRLINIQQNLKLIVPNEPIMKHVALKPLNQTQFTSVQFADPAKFINPDIGITKSPTITPMTSTLKSVNSEEKEHRQLNSYSEKQKLNSYSEKQKRKIRTLQQQNRRLRARVDGLRKTMKFMKTSKVDLEIDNLKIPEMLPPATVAIVKDILQPSKKNRISSHTRDFAETLYSYSSAAYNYVRERFNNRLPHPDSLKRWCRDEGEALGFSSEEENYEDIFRMEEGEGDEEEEGSVAEDEMVEEEEEEVVAEDEMVEEEELGMVVEEVAFSSDDESPHEIIEIKMVDDIEEQDGNES